MSESLWAAFQAWQNGAPYPRICGNPACMTWYNPSRVDGGQADLEGLTFHAGECRWPTEYLNICPECMMRALAGRKPFRRNGLDIFA